MAACIPGRLCLRLSLLKGQLGRQQGPPGAQTCVQTARPGVVMSTDGTLFESTVLKLAQLAKSGCKPVRQLQNPFPPIPLCLNCEKQAGAWLHGPFALVSGHFFT